jgi:hypothetical protein
MLKDIHCIGTKPHQIVNGKIQCHYNISIYIVLAIYVKVMLKLYRIIVKNLGIPTSCIIN